MKHEAALNKLQVSLSETIDNWIANNCESPEWESLDAYTGEDIHESMAKAAIAVLDAVVSVQDYLKDDGQLKT